MKNPVDSLSCVIVNVSGSHLQSQVSQVTNLSSFQNYPLLDHHITQMTNTAGFKPFAMEEPMSVDTYIRFSCMNQQWNKLCVSVSYGEQIYSTCVAYTRSTTIIHLISVSVKVVDIYLAAS